ncbi:MAG: aspartate carbamoyltransferase [Patescibacteria group bacterium]
MADIAHILEAQQFDRKTIEELFKSADKLEKRKDHSLKGKILAAIFYEPSTRTRLSFESAMLRLGGGVIATENARDYSSAAKGESVEDTMQMINHYADVAVIRHYEKGSSAKAASVATIPVINAGDGAGQHPTQALLALYTVWRELGRMDTLKIAAVGDLKNGRAVRSFVYLLGKFKKISLVFVSPPELKMLPDIKEYMGRHGITFTETASLEEGIRDADVVYMTRVQKERFADAAEYERLKGSYILARAHADSMKKGSIIMHPLPRVGEIALEVDSSPKAIYFRQAKYGILVRMALLKRLLG